jgi:hypothetical protein
LREILLRWRMREVLGGEVIDGRGESKEARLKRRGIKDLRNEYIFECGY